MTKFISMIGKLVWWGCVVSGAFCFSHFANDPEPIGQVGRYIGLVDFAGGIIFLIYTKIDDLR